MDSIDRRILEVLQTDGRITNQDLADRIGLSPSPTLRRVRNLEQSGVISGYGAIVSPAALGLGVLAVIEIAIADHSTPQVETFEQALRANPSIVAAHMIAGDGDYLITVLVRDLDDFERFVVDELRAIGNIASIRSKFAFGTVKDRGPLLPPPQRPPRKQ
ncbi:Lrp/AsnC family transcriptional regulator [Pseudonocardia sp. TRM90224]|uniref:Lrp/AsnC family transcriptional regulator n=1 Tax=Pseudonocardia sp. TRM90224 TaxID=2812678 RepID=UPI001E35BD94|nr:Lrp/AsnC family transcriptional regulator [Pseudonocardia sp. TRM90224]